MRGWMRHWSERHQVYMAIGRRARTAPTTWSMPRCCWRCSTPICRTDGTALRIRGCRRRKKRSRTCSRANFRSTAAADAPALGRSRGDRYFGGGAWYPTTLAAAGILLSAGAAPTGSRGAHPPRRCVHGDGAGSDAGRRRAVRAGGPGDRRADLGPPPDLELCGLRQRSPAARSGPDVRAHRIGIATTQANSLWISRSPWP